MPHREISNFESYGLVRIGTAVNYLTRNIIDNRHKAFDMRRLAAINGFDASPDTVLVQSFQADAYSTKCQNAWSSEHSKKKKAGTPFCRVAVESHTQNSMSQMNTASSSSLTVGMAVIGYELSLGTLTEAELFSCAYDPFRNALTAVCEAKDLDTWWAAYTAFVRDFGHGFVSSIRLMSCAAGELKTSETSDGVRQQQNYSRGISGGGVCEFGGGGGSGAKGWAQEHVASGAKGKLTSNAAAFPAQSPCKDWVDKVMEKYTSAELPAIAAAPPDIPPAPTPDVKAPEIPELQPVEGPSPQAALSDKEQEMTEQLHSKQMKADDVDPKTSWDEYQSALNAEAAGLDKNDLAKESEKPATLGAPPNWDHFGSSAQPVEASGGGDNVNFGQYFIYDVDFTSYAEVFPTLLKVRAAPSRTALNLAKINMFVMTRQLIASYLNFVSALPLELTGKFVTIDYAKDFTAALTEYVDEVSNTPAFDETTYRQKVSRFDRILQEKNLVSSEGDTAYRFFVKNFTYLSDAPYGFLLTVSDTQGRYFYPKWDSWSAKTGSGPYEHVPYELTQFGSMTDGVDVSALVRTAYRAFPIVVRVPDSGDAGLGFAFYVPSKGEPKGNWLAVDGNCGLAPGEKAGAFRFKKVKRFDTWVLQAETADWKKLSLDLRAGSSGDQLSFVWLSDHSPGRPFEFHPIDYKHVEGGTVHGIPMWYELPFQAIKDSLKEGFRSMAKIR
jgi:hypothetical protein